VYIDNDSQNFIFFITYKLYKLIKNYLKNTRVNIGSFYTIIDPGANWSIKIDSLE